MIFGIGTDIVRVQRMHRGLDRFGDRLAHRLLTPDELAEFRHHRRPAHFLARRFAAKEAAVKAMGTGFRDGLQTRHIGVSHDPKGRPALEFYGPARSFLQRHGVASAHLSLADEDDYAIAFVVLACA